MLSRRIIWVAFVISHQSVFVAEPDMAGFRNFALAEQLGCISLAASLEDL